MIVIFKNVIYETIKHRHKPEAYYLTRVVLGKSAEGTPAKLMTPMLREYDK